MARRDRLMRGVLRERFVATLRGGETFDGLLVEVDDKTFRFANAWAIDGTQRKAVDGELFLPRSEVTYMQKLGATT